VRREVDVANSRWTSSGLGRSLRVVRVVVVPYSLLALGRWPWCAYANRAVARGRERRRGWLAGPSYFDDV